MNAENKDTVYFKTVKDSDIEAVRAFLLENLGLKFSKNQERELVTKLSNASKHFGFEDTSNFANWLLKQQVDNKLIEKLACFLTIGETYFFREQKALNYLEFEYLPKLIEQRRRTTKQLRIWSAGCASGEEPYTVAIILKRLIRDIEQWNITLLATDINLDFLNKAKKGVYTKWSFRGLPDSFKLKYFKELDNSKYAINSDIKRMVKFSYLNLAIDHFPSLESQTNAFDVILCRNVLIYFSLEGTIAVTRKLYQALVDGGLLLVSPVEASNFITPDFYRFSYKGISIYEKDPDKKSVINEYGSTNTAFDIFFPKKAPTLPQVKNNYLSEKILNNHSFEKPKKAIEFDLKKSKTESSEKESQHKAYEKAVLLYEEGKYTEAEILLESSFEKNSTNQPYLLLLARIKANKGLLVESEKLCLKGIASNKVDERAYYLLATIQSEQGKTSAAVESLNKTLFLNPDFSLGHFLLGNLLMDQGKKSEARKHYTNALNSISKMKPDEIIHESDGMSANRLKEIINSYLA